MEFWRGTAQRYRDFACWVLGSHGSGRTGMLWCLFLFSGLFDGFPRLKNRKTLSFEFDDRRHFKIVAISLISYVYLNERGSATAC